MGLLMLMFADTQKEASSLKLKWWTRILFIWIVFLFWPVIVIVGLILACRKRMR